MEEQAGREGGGGAGGDPCVDFLCLCRVMPCVGAFIQPDAIDSGQKEDAFFREVHRAEISPLPLGQEYPVMSAHRPLSPPSLCKVVLVHKI